MKRLFFISLFLCFSFFSCQTSENEQEDKSKDNLINDPRSPNPSSELAVLMRDVWEYADTLKNQITDSTSTTLLPDYQARFKEIHAAIPTKSDIKSPVFDAMAAIMLQKLKNVYQNQNKEQSVQVEGFNLFVKSCVQCHEQQCPGPISKISKLIINN